MMNYVQQRKTGADPVSALRTLLLSLRKAVVDVFA